MKHVEKEWNEVYCTLIEIFIKRNFRVYIIFSINIHTITLYFINIVSTYYKIIIYIIKVYFININATKK